ncbi:MAG: UDP-N-acetylmuramoyl-L-alanine--D-glutamate ligase [Candidatus Microsaccharimonas sp.]
MKIAIAGYGVEGQENFRYWSQWPENELTIVDENGTGVPIPEGVRSLVGPGVFGQLQDFDLVIRTASLPPNKIVTNGTIWSATNEFFAKSPAPIIGVTGTKGKGTTSSMITAILKTAGKKAWLVGNIGVPSLPVLSQVQPEDVVVYELSSFQLWDVQRSPHISVVLPIEPEHLDVHANFEEYVNAKANIAKYQTSADICVFNPNNEYSAGIGHSNSQTRAIEYTTQQPSSVYIENGLFKQDGELICAVSALKLKGEHNRENACAALTVAKQLGISNEIITTGLEQFQGLPHRLEYVRSPNGVDYYNDSFSSSPPATVAAARAFSEPEILIVGGINRGGDFSHLATELLKQSNIREVILIGEYRQELQRIFQEVGIQTKLTVLDATTMHEIVRYAASVAQPGEVVILSPGCASFDMFKDFYDRGDQFRNEVKAL